MTRRANGEGSFWHNDKENYWRWTIQLKDFDGNPHVYALVSKNRPELKQKIKKFMEEYEATRQPMREYITMSKFVNYWLNAIKPTVRLSTWEFYETLCRCHILPEFGNKKICEITPLQTQNFLNSLSNQRQRICKEKLISPTTSNSIRQTLIAIFNAAIDNKIIGYNPAAKTKRQKTNNKEKVVVDADTLNKILSIANTKNYIYIDTVKSKQTGAIVYYPEQHRFFEDPGMVYNRHCFLMEITLAAFTGMRLGEVLGLKWSEINFTTSELLVKGTLLPNKKIGPPKGGKERKILLDEQTLNQLKDWKNEQANFATKYYGNFNNKENLVFTNMFGNFISIRNQKDSYWNKLLIAASVPSGFTFHSFRHTHATLLLKSGVDIKTVSERLGHSSAVMTLNVYAHALPSMQSTAIEAVKNLRN